MTRDEADDIKRHFDVVAERLEGQIRQVAEGVVLANERLDRVDQRLDRMDQRMDRFETEVRAEFAEIKAMIKLSFAELERRLSALEGVVEQLMRRVERLENPPA